MKTVLFSLTIAALMMVGYVHADVSKAQKLDGLIVLDGKLDETAWQNAATSAPFHLLKRDGKRPPLANTTFKILADSKAVYFGIRCEEPQMGQLQDGPLPQDGPGWERDCVELFIDPTGKGIEYYQFMITAGNAHFNAYFIEGGNTQGGHYGGIWESAVYKGKDFWSVEVKIPISAFYYTSPSDFSDKWLVDVARERKPVGELTSWSPVDKGFHEPSHFNRIAGLPRKDLKCDIRIGDLKAQLSTASGNTYNGWLEIKTVAGKQAAGEYRVSIFDQANTAVVSNRTMTIPESHGTEKLDNVAFKVLGTMTATVRVQNSNGETVHELYYPLKVRYAPLTVDITEPFYGQCIFPGQKVAQIAGRVTANLSEESMKDSVLKVSLSGPGIAAQSVSKELNGDSADFSLPALDLPIGEYQLTCTVLSKNKTLASKTVTIRKLRKPQGSCVYVDKNLNLVVNGKPIFARGWYGDEEGDFLVSVALLQKYPQPDSRLVNAWRRQVSIQTESLGQYINKCYQGKDRARIWKACADACGVPLHSDVEPEAAIFELMKKVIEANRTNRQFWWYYLCDEPECRMISPVYLKHLYDFIKKEDPYHPVMIITREPEKYTECADILNVHPYGAPSSVGPLIRSVLSAGKHRIPAWFTPAAFSYGVVNGFVGADYPKFGPFNSGIYSSIANGCKGIRPFIYYDHFNSIDLRLGVDFIYDTLADLEEFLISPEEPLAVKVGSPAKGVEVWIKRIGDRVLVIAVNIQGKAAHADIECDGLKDISKVYGYREKAEVKLDRGRFSLDFSPYQVHLLSSPERGAGMKSVETLLEEIAAATAALKKPGNILYGRTYDIEWDASDTYIPSKSLYTLTDGMCDTLGWRDVNQKAPARVEMSFPGNLVPTFKSAKIYSATVEDLEFWIWSKADWVKIGEVKGNHKPVISLDFGKQVTTYKIKIMMPKVHPGTKAELYEIELYE